MSTGELCRLAVCDGSRHDRSGSLSAHMPVAETAAASDASASGDREMRDVAADDEVESLWCAYEAAHESYFGVASSDTRDAEYGWIAEPDAITATLSEELAVAHGAESCETLMKWSNSAVALRAALFDPTGADDTIDSFWETHRTETPGCAAFIDTD